MEGFFIELVYSWRSPELNATPRDTMGAGVEKTFERTGVSVT